MKKPIQADKEEGSQSNLAPQIQDEIKILNQQQLLINQYMHMNIQLLNHKLQCLQKKPKEDSLIKNEKQEEQGLSKEAKRKTKKIIKCGHEEKPHYAKGLCNNCYHKYGRNKKPWKCSHEKLYAGGMCQNCYINNYNKKKREKVKEEQISEIQQSGKQEIDIKYEEKHEE